MSERVNGAGLRYYDCPICEADESLEREEYTDASYVICSECGAVIEAYEWDEDEE
jgi:transcription initiation factor TFIIIB Brf1 subunit/transcription initiation factor TFIIB